MESKDMALQIAAILDSKKATNIRVLKVRNLTVLTDYFVIATGTSSTHVASLADEVDFLLGKQGIEPLRIEGRDAKRWVLVDYGAVILHVFTPDAHDFYDLEHLWADADPVDVTEYLAEQAAKAQDKE